MVETIGFECVVNVKSITFSKDRNTTAFWVQTGNVRRTAEAEGSHTVKPLFSKSYHCNRLKKDKRNYPGMCTVLLKERKREMVGVKNYAFYFSFS